MFLHVGSSSKTTNKPIEGLFTLRRLRDKFLPNFESKSSNFARFIKTERNVKFEMEWRCLLIRLGLAPKTRLCSSLENARPVHRTRQSQQEGLCFKIINFATQFEQCEISWNRG